MTVLAYVGRNSMVFFLMEGVVLMNCAKILNLLGFEAKYLMFSSQDATMSWRIAMTAIGLLVTAALPPLINPLLRLVKCPFLSKASRHEEHGV